MAVIPGYNAVLELGAVPYNASVVGKTVNLRKTFTSLNRTVFGSVAQVRAGGVYGVAFTFQGLVDSTGYASLEALARGVAVAFKLEVGDEAGTHAGAWAGSCLITEITAEADVEGDWTVSISAESTGAVTFS